MTYLSQPEVEVAVIGCLLAAAEQNKPQLVDQALDVLREDTFTRTDCRRALTVIQDARKQAKIVDPILFFEAWRKRWPNEFPTEILDAPNQVDHILNLPWYLEDVLSAARARKSDEARAHLVNLAKTPEVSIDTLKAEIERQQVEQDTPENTYDSPRAVQVMVNDLERRFNLHNEHKRSGLETGFALLDYKLDGLQFGEQTIIGARPSQGKTAIAVNIACNVVFNLGVPVLFITLEMSVQALMRRIFSDRKSVKMGILRSGEMSQGTFASLSAFAAKTKELPLYFEDGIGRFNSNDIERVVNYHTRLHGVRLVIIDYLQKIRSLERNEKRTYEVGAVSTHLKAIAVKSGVAMLTLAQLNREPEKDKQRPPRLTDLADSGQIERDADTVLLLQKDDDGAGCLIIAKQRDGELGTVPLQFNGEFCKFISAPREEKR